MLLAWTTGLAPFRTGAAADSPGLRECGLSEEEHQLAALLLGGQQDRKSLRCDPALQAFARSRARDMADRGYLSHQTPERVGPNQLLRDSGYPLPPTYRNGLSNNVESLVGGIPSATDVWRVLTTSETHRRHIVGGGPAFAEQDEFGLAYHRDIHSPHVDYWVIIIARRGKWHEPKLVCTPEPAECFETGALSGRLAGGQGVAGESVRSGSPADEPSPPSSGRRKDPP